LCWAVSAGATSDVASVEDLRGKAIGIRLTLFFLRILFATALLCVN
jgi:hypothetical protein